MKELLKGIWTGPATTTAAVLVAAGTYALEHAAEVDLPQWASVTVGMIVAGLLVYGGKEKMP